MNSLWQSCWTGYAAAPAAAAAAAPEAGAAQPQHQHQHQAAGQPLHPPFPPPPRPLALALATPSAPPKHLPPLPPPISFLSLEQWAAVLAALAPPSGGAPARAVPAFEASMFKAGDVRGLLALHGGVPPKTATKTV